MGKQELKDKISILSGAAKYDASCATSGSCGFSGSGGAKTKFGTNLPMGVCHSWTQDGRCVSLLKVLYSNVCRYDCAYCVNRASADIPRASFSPTELADLTCEFYRRNYIEGLFLSSGIFSDPDIVMEKLIETAKHLRTVSGFGGYIHLKMIPGTGDKMILEAGKWADRLSCNIELPTEKSLVCLAPQKSKEDILGAMNDFSNYKCEFDKTRDKNNFLPSGKTKTRFFSPAGQSTQLIVGATEENDKQIVNLTSSLYNKFSLKRVYYSAFIHPTPGGQKNDPRLPEIVTPPLVREHRLYQADWLLRFYHFKAHEILSEEEPNLDSLLDPKTVWALRNLDFFPIEINRADYETLLRIPGVGAKTARRIIEQRRSRSLSLEGLSRMGAVLKRGRYFLTANGARLDRPDDPARIRRLLSGTDGAGLQLPLFDF